MESELILSHKYEIKMSTLFEYRKYVKHLLIYLKGFLLIIRIIL